MNTKTSQTLSPRTNPSASPEFEFWMVRNPSFPQPNILSADQLIVNGVLLPLHLINKPDPPHEPDPEPPTINSAPVRIDSGVTASKRWKDIFKKSDKKNSENNDAEEKKKKSSVTTSAELNINIWPFSRSRSAGNAGTRPKLFGPAARKANSAPCSRSNSAGESKSRKWASSPGRAGVHLGRSSPVWQVRRPKNNNNNNNNNNPEPPLLNSDKSKRRSKLAGAGNATAKTRVLNLNVPMCIGYRHHLTCRSDDNSAIRVSTGSRIRGNSNCNNNNNYSNTTGHGHGNVGGKLFNLRSLFTKKTVVTSH